MGFLKEIEAKWQKKWEDAKIFEANPELGRKKIFVTFPYPYMNGPLHVGHAFTATRVDVFARFKRMQGYNVLWPWSWHWTGQPLLGASQRVAKGDKEYIRILREVDGVPEAELKGFVDPLHMATYYTDEGRRIAKRIGFSIDWRREFHTGMPTYQKFIAWQYTNLKEKGYVTKGTHPVVWCPKDKSPTGDHDRQVGEGVTPESYVLIKFKLNAKTYLPAATFRPETIFGLTNMWINPKAVYVEADVNGENWIISGEAAEKLKEQNKTVHVIRSFEGKELIGKHFENPLTKLKFPILPGWFVNTNQATGVVYSVPAHAPYDWLALRDLQVNPETLKEFGIDPEVVKRIKPISLIEIAGFGEYPAVELVDKLNVSSQKDPKAAEATKTLYKKEFHNGILKANCGQYAGRLVKEVKESLVSDLEKLGVADSMYDLPQPVVCRCLTPCSVKILSNQWFLDYSDKAWKEKTKTAVGKMKIYPNSATQWFLVVIDWLKEWACARTTGFGTPLPWGKGWIIETLSDSTIYMAFYTISKHIRQHGIKPENLQRELFDFIFLGKGDKMEVSQETGIDSDVLDKMREEFLYWYPFDLRVSAKELVPNHLTFCIFHHVAMFPPEQWPKAMGVNGMLMIEGKPMHKSKGNFVTMKNAVESYGADATRCALLLGAEAMDDPNWRSKNVQEIQSKLEALFNYATNIIENAKTPGEGHIEKWLMSRLQNRVSQVTSNLDELKTRTSLEIALFEIWNDFRWYNQRKEKTNSDTLRKALKVWLRLLAPFAPYLSEELWAKMNNDGFISLAEWPKMDDKQVDEAAEERENFLIDLIEDTLNILKATKLTPTKIFYYTAVPWKRKVYNKILEETMRGEVMIRNVMKGFAKEEELKGNLGTVSQFVSKVVKILNKIPVDRKSRFLKIGIMDEKKIIEAASTFLKDRFNAEIIVYDEESEDRYDPKQRAKFAIPFQPAIFIE